MTVNHYLTGSDEPAEIYDPTLSLPSTEARHVSKRVELFLPHVKKKNIISMKSILVPPKWVLISLRTLNTRCISNVLAGYVTLLSRLCLAEECVVLDANLLLVQLRSRIYICKFWYMLHVSLRSYVCCRLQQLENVCGQNDYYKNILKKPHRESFLFPEIVFFFFFFFLLFFTDEKKKKKKKKKN